MKTLIIGLAIAATFLTSTNRPSKETYADYLIENWQSEICSQRSLPPDERRWCDISIIVPNSLKSYVVQRYAMEKNQVLFTTYYFKLGNFENRSVFIGGQFFNL